jgi:hypothetical protein
VSTLKTKESSVCGSIQASSGHRSMIAPTCSAVRYGLPCGDNVHISVWTVHVSVWPVEVLETRTQ